MTTSSMSTNSLFIMVWKVVGELHRPKNIIISLKEPWWQMKVAFHSSPLMYTLLYPHRSSIFVKYQDSLSLLVS